MIFKDMEKIPAVYIMTNRYKTMEEAIIRKKQLKGKSREKKMRLIEGLNPQWHDLYELLNT